MNFTSGPKVASSGVGRKVPACSGPATNSQKGSNPRKDARSGMVVMRGRVVHVGGDPHDVAHAGVAATKRRSSAISSSRPSGAPGSPLATASEFAPSGMASPIGMSQAITFQVARERGQRGLQPAQLGGAEDAGGAGKAAAWRLGEFAPR